MNELALFAGAGGGILGGKLLGWTTVCAVERDAYAAQVLAQRQNDRILKPFPIWSDVTTFDGNPWRGIVDVISGGFPCQDISAAAGNKATGIGGARSGLWSEMVRIIREVRPRCVYVENSPVLTSRGLGRVLGDLAALGFDAQWGVLGASDVGADHERERIWILANAGEIRYIQQEGSSEITYNKNGITKTCWQGWNPESDTTIPSCEISNSERIGCAQMVKPIGGRTPCQGAAGSFGPSTGRWWPAEPGMGRVVDGVADRVDRLAALGNGQVPRVAATAWEILSK